MSSVFAPPIQSTVDDYLGPAEQRFFGRGFRRVRYDTAGYDCRCEQGGAEVGAMVGVAYPADWSRKATGDLRPHFSTIDALVLAAQATELALAQGYGLDAGQVSRTWFRKVRITAGTQPQEDLAQLPLKLTLRPQGNLGARAVSISDTRIGTMRVRCEAEHELGPVHSGATHHAGPDALLGPAGGRYFGEGFKTWRQRIVDVAVDHAEARAEARLFVEDDSSIVPAPPGRTPSVSMVDGFVTALQLAQVLLYELDGVRREDSETLWMRQTTFTADHPEPLRADGLPVKVSLENAERLAMAGGLWRTADIVGDFGALSVRSAVTHRLPS